MKSRDYIGRCLNINKVNNYNHTYLPDNYDTQVYRVYIDDNGYEAKEHCYFYMDIFMDENATILAIERNKEIFLTNYIVKRFPPYHEEQAREIMSNLTIDS